MWVGTPEGVYTRYLTRLLSCDILPLYYRREYLDANLLHKTIHGSCNPYILTKLKFSTLRNNANVDNRDVGNLLPIIANTETYKHFYTHRIVHIWNSIPLDIRVTPFGKSGKSFKKKLISFLKTKFISTFNPDNTCTWVCRCRCQSCRL